MIFLQKQRPAPSPPVASRAPVSYKYGLAPNISHTSSHNNVMKLASPNHDK